MRERVDLGPSPPTCDSDAAQNHVGPRGIELSTALTHRYDELRGRTLALALPWAPRSRRRAVARVCAEYDVRVRRASQVVRAREESFPVASWRCLAAKSIKSGGTDRGPRAPAAAERRPKPPPKRVLGS